MAAIQYYDVILKPVVTEKSMNAMAEKKYTFLVHPEATKSQIKEAVEKMFEGTKVKSVNTMNLDGKTRHGLRKDSKNEKSYRGSDRGKQGNRNFRGTVRFSSNHTQTSVTINVKRPPVTGQGGERRKNHGN